jgi:hypothetical protein
VRGAKKENLIKSYEIDVNSRIYVRENENISLQITDMKEILKYFPGENVNEFHMACNGFYFLH